MYEVRCGWANIYDDDAWIHLFALAALWSYWVVLYLNFKSLEVYTTFGRPSGDDDDAGDDDDGVNINNETNDDDADSSGNHSVMNIVIVKLEENPIASQQLRQTNIQTFIAYHFSWIKI